MERYAEYKDSGVEWIGDIPSHWSCSKLDYLIDSSRRLTYGIVQAGPKLDEGVPYIRPMDMTDDGLPSVEQLPKTSEEIAAKYVRSMVKPGDLVMSIGPSFGKVAIAQKEHDGANLTQGTARVAASASMNNRFLYWTLCSPGVMNFWDSVATGATFHALNLEPLSKTMIGVPPVEEQERIVAFLDERTGWIDEAVKKTKKKIALLKEQRASLINEVVTKGLDSNVEMKDSGVEWIGDIPSHWMMSRFKYSSEIVTGSTPSRAEESLYYAESGLPWVKPSILMNSLKPIFEAEEYLTERGGEEVRVVPKGSILFCSIGNTLGKYGVAGIDLATNQQINSVVCDGGGLNAQYCLYYVSFLSESLINRVNFVTLPIFTKSDFESTELILPPLEEQERIVAFLDERTGMMDEVIAKEEERITLLKEYRQSLISEVVTGKRRVLDEPVGLN